MADSFLDLVNGVLTLKPTVASSAGAGDAGKIPRLGDDGLLDPSMMPVIPGSVPIASDVASNNSYLLFDGVFSSSYDVYEIHFIDLAPVADSAALLWRWRDAGADVTGTTHYTGFRYRAPVLSAAGDLFANSTAGHHCPYIDLGNASGECCKLRIIAFPRSTARKEIFFEGSYVNYLGNLIQVNGASTLANTTAMTGCKILFIGTNIASGKVVIYGAKLP
ncbi:MAG: hypothetical protein KDB04_16245 [Acidimicrobiales bacterium]|nr:hypothetical protein [Acidimicrobiales bacterium]